MKRSSSILVLVFLLIGSYALAQTAKTVKQTDRTEWSNSLQCRIEALKVIELEMTPNTSFSIDSSRLVDPVELAQQQLDAYNARDIEAFLVPYDDNVAIYNFPKELIMQGKEQMRPIYTNLFTKSPELHCELVNRIVLGNTVIDQERVTGMGGVEVLEAIAIYKIKEGKIHEVYFMK